MTSYFKLEDSLEAQNIHILGMEHVIKLQCKNLFVIYQKLEIIL